MSWTKARSDLGHAAKAFGPDHPKTIEARRNFRAEKLADHVRKVVAEAPPLTQEQRDRIAAILRGGAGE
ncbi:hypothetical protein BOH72_11210 [Mycobacterium sp. WY10]|nr:hypothetical protein BOH72_11210 [Mycobacterium sp. WY10]